MTKQFPRTTALLVWDYFDHLINNLDIYTEVSIKRDVKNKKQELARLELPRIKIGQRRPIEPTFSFLTTNSNKHHVDPYNSSKFDETRSTCSLKNEILASMPTDPTLIEYFKCISSEAIKRMKQLRDELISKVKRSPSLSNVIRVN
jgi:hypothetical protein